MFLSIKGAIITVLLCNGVYASYEVRQNPNNPRHYKIVNLDVEESTMVVGSKGSYIAANNTILNNGMPTREYVCTHPDTTFTGDAFEVFCGEFFSNSTESSEDEESFTKFMSFNVGQTIKNWKYYEKVKDAGGIILSVTSAIKTWTGNTYTSPNEAKPHNAPSVDADEDNSGNQV